MRWLLAYAAFLAVAAWWLGTQLEAGLEYGVSLLGLPVQIGLFLWFGAPVLAAIGYQAVRWARGGRPV
jgi:hypothetical protein